MRPSLENIMPLVAAPSYAIILSSNSPLPSSLRPHFFLRISLTVRDACASASIEAAGKENARRRRRLSRASERVSKARAIIITCRKWARKGANDSKFLFSRRSLDPDSVGRDPIRSLDSASAAFYSISLRSLILFPAIMTSPPLQDASSSPRCRRTNRVEQIKT